MLLPAAAPIAPIRSVCSWMHWHFECRPCNPHVDMSVVNLWVRDSFFSDWWAQRGQATVCSWNAKSAKRYCFQMCEDCGFPNIAEASDCKAWRVIHKMKNQSCSLRLSVSQPKMWVSVITGLRPLCAKHCSPCIGGYDIFVHLFRDDHVLLITQIPALPCVHWRKDFRISKIGLSG